jgi:hypothetical protein
VQSKRYRNLDTSSVANGLKNIGFIIGHPKNLRIIIERNSVSAG